MAHPLPKASLDQLFFEAHTHNEFEDREVPDALLGELIDLLKWAPTSANSSPARFVFVKSADAKARLVPLMFPGNDEKTRKAPVTAIVGYDLEFYEHLPKLFPHTDARAWFAGKPDFIQSSAFRNGSLQGAYLILAARALGLACGPMSGFDNAGVDREFFAETQVKSNFVVNLGYARPGEHYPRAPRFAFSEVAKIV